jgi:cytochrome c-type biogenesis protein CcmH/NrfG
LLEKVVAQQPDNVDAVFNLAGSYKALGNFDKALALFEKTVAANPKDHEAWYNLGRIYDEQNKMAEAVQALQMVVDLKPTGVNGWMALSRAYARKSQHESGDVAGESAKKAQEAFNMAESLEGN